jgi:hypothetical protein
VDIFSTIMQIQFRLQITIPNGQWLRFEIQADPLLKFDLGCAFASFDAVLRKTDDENTNVPALSIGSAWWLPLG